MLKRAFNSDAIDRAVEKAIEERAFPGAAVAIGDKNGIIYKANYGYKRVFDDNAPCFDWQSNEKYLYGKAC